MSACLSARTLKRLLPSRRVMYLNLDYGIDLCGTKGASVHMRAICRALARLGQQVTVYSARCSGARPPLRNAGITLMQPGLPSDFQRLRKDLRRVYGPELQIPYELRQAALNRDSLEQLETLWTSSPIDLVIERLSLMGVAGVRAAARLNIPHFLEVNALLSEEARQFRGLLDYDTARRVEDEVFATTRAIFTVSDDLRDAVIARGADPQRVHTLPNGYDEFLFRPGAGRDVRRRLGLGNSYVIGMAGSMKAWHGVGTLLQAFELMSRREQRIALLLIGDGPEMPRIRQFATEHPRLKVIVAGAVSHARVASLLRACDATVAPYDQLDGFYFSPMKVYEYMALGKPVVASGQGQISDMIRHGRTGLLFPPGQARALSERLIRLKREPELARRLGEAGREAVLHRTWTMNAARLMAMYEELPSV